MQCDDHEQTHDVVRGDERPSECPNYSEKETTRICEEYTIDSAQIISYTNKSSMYVINLSTNSRKT